MTKERSTKCWKICT